MGSVRTPGRPAKLVFVHHSCGENWLADENGGLGIALRDNGYFVSDTNYHWGPQGIGDTTDMGHLWLWFRGPESSVYLDALFAENERRSQYSRLPDEPAGENEIVMFKGCYPNSALKGTPADVVPPISGNPLRGESCWTEHHTLANAKGIYEDILHYFATRQDRLFVVITAPPLVDPAYAANARVLNTWLVHEWLRGYPHRNVAVFDYYNVLTSSGGDPHTNDLGKDTGSHHRFSSGRIEHTVGREDGAEADVLKYPYVPGNNHPSRAGNMKATAEFVPLLNVFCERWVSAVHL
jgi:hypothetical protein